MKNPFENEKTDSKLEVVEFQNNIEKIKYLKNLKGSLFFTTTPSIGTSVFPKSQIRTVDKTPKYIYLFHSLVSPNEMYVKNSFKNFDFIFSPCKTISDQIENLVSTNTKIFETGYLLFNEVDVFNFNDRKNNKVLLAPTWGPGVKQISRSINKINEFVIHNKLELVFRPHPMTDVESLKLHPTIEIDRSKNLINLDQYSNLITDFSGIALGYFYLTGRPVIFLDVKKKIKRKLNNNEKDLTLIEDLMRSMLGKVIKIDDLAKYNLNTLKPKSESRQFIESLNDNKNSLNRSVELANRLIKQDDTV